MNVVTILIASIFIGQHFNLSHLPSSPIRQFCIPIGIMPASFFLQVLTYTSCHSQTRTKRTNHPFFVRCTFFFCTNAPLGTQHNAPTSSFVVRHVGKPGRINYCFGKMQTRSDYCHRVNPVGLPCAGLHRPGFINLANVYYFFRYVPYL